MLGCTHYPLVEENIHRLYPQPAAAGPGRADGPGPCWPLSGARTAGRTIGPRPGRLDIFTTGSAEEYTMKAAKVGLDPVTSVQFYPPMKL
ncbi:MAG: hypothetical protein ACLR0P_06715 [Oscillospiraceae bacterium]